MTVSSLSLNGVLIAFVLIIIIGYAVWGVSKILMALIIGFQERKDERLRRQVRIEHMATHELRSFLLNHAYFTGLKDTKVIRDLITKVNEGREKDFLKSLSEAGFYRLLVSAEHEAGHNGRPEAVDYSSEIWDILQELSKSGRTHGTA